MARQNLETLKRYYNQIKNLHKEAKEIDDSSVAPAIVDVYNPIIDQITDLMEDDYSNYKVSSSALKQSDLGPYYSNEDVYSKMSLTIGLLETELNVDEENRAAPQNIVNFINQNENTLAVNIQQTINQIIEQEGDGEIKTQLKELDEAITQKDESKLKKTLSWLLENSFDLAIKILPELLKRWGS